MQKTCFIQHISTSKAPPAIGPYSQAVKTSNFVFCSGQIGLDARTGILCKGTIADETRVVLKNLKRVLEASGTGFDHIVKTTVFLTDMKHFEEMNKVYEEYFQVRLPARSTVQVAALPKGASIEIEVVAIAM